MNRSRRWLLLIINMVIIGLTMVVGIVIYNNTISRDLSSILQKEVVADFDPVTRINNRIFNISGKDITRIDIARGGEHSLSISKELNTEKSNKEMRWVIEGDNLLRIDRKKLDRYVLKLLKLSFSSVLNPGTSHTYADFGLDYPLYELKITDNDNVSILLTVGAKLPGSNSHYAIINNDLSKIGVLSDQIYLLKEDLTDFFTEEIIDIPAANVNKLSVYYPMRPLNLVFQKETNGKWMLIEPSRLATRYSEIESTLLNILALNAKQYFPYGQAHLLKVDIDNPLNVFKISSNEKEVLLIIYSDQIGNYYGKFSDKDWLFLLPESFQLIVSKPISLLLDPIPSLPPWDNILNIEWKNENVEMIYSKLDGIWYYLGHALDDQENQKLKFWYNSLGQNSLLQTSEDSFPYMKPFLKLKVITDKGEEYTCGWLKSNDEQGEFTTKGNRTNLVFRLPKNPPRFSTLERTER